MEPVTPVAAGERAVAFTTVVDAPAAEVFALLANPHRHHEVDGSGSVKQQVIGPRELRAGDKFRTSMRMAAVPYAMTNTVTRVETDRLVEWRHVGGHLWRWEFEDLGEGRTRVTETFDASTSRVPFAMRLIRAYERNATGIERSLRRLQQRFA
ncbi:MAG: SRPBCC family protein [Mobilicoccus sp.]|nr:SRPBCC family protein [Mobilicoccus sp.]